MTATHNTEVAALAVAAARATMPPAAPRFAQPQIDLKSMRLLHSGYEHGELYLDLYGAINSYGYEVETVSLVGMTICMSEVFSPKQLEQMGAWCDRNLPSANELLLVSHQDSAADRAMWEKCDRLMTII